LQANRDLPMRPERSALARQVAALAAILFITLALTAWLGPRLPVLGGNLPPSTPAGPP
jgi:hypothetical protein